MTDKPCFLTRKELTKRWKVSIRFLDRLRADGTLAYVDLKQGRSRRPVVRFRLEDVAALEETFGKGGKE